MIPASLVLGISQPGNLGGRRLEWRIGEDAQPQPLARDAITGYDPRARDWYHLAAASDRPVWADPYFFPDGTRGVTMALALHQPGSSVVRGVFGADFRLAELSSTLEKFARERSNLGSTQYALLTGAAISWPRLARQPRVLACRPSGSAGSRRAAGCLDARGHNPGIQASSRWRDLDRDSEVRVLAPELESVLVGLVPESQFLEVVDRGLRRATFAGIAVLLAAALVGLFISRRITSPLRLHGL